MNSRLICTSARTRSGYAARHVLPADWSASQSGSSGKMNYIGTWWCRLLTVALLIGIAETCVRIPTRLQLRLALSTMFPLFVRLIEACVLSSFSCPGVGIGVKKVQREDGGLRLIASSPAYSRYGKKSTDAVRISVRFKESRLHREKWQREKIFAISKRVNTRINASFKLMTEYHLFYSRYQAREEYSDNRGGGGGEIEPR